MKTNQILVAASFATGRDAAFERGLALARASGAALYVLHAVPANRKFSEGATHRRERAAELRARAERAGVLAQTAEQHGDPAEIIELHATAREPDLIVMGAERTFGSRWLRRPTTAERVLRRTTTPTLIVPADDEGDAGFGNVLVAVDLSAASKHIVQHALQLTASGSPAVTVVHAARGIEAAAAIQSPARWKVPEYRALLVEDARRELETMIGDVSNDVDVRIRIVTGPHAKAIVAEAEMANADLVVVGRSDRFRPLGSTALRVLRDNQRAMLVVPGLELEAAGEGESQKRRAA
jgi:nucleotide-binding universal stress UspA family protein